MRVCVCLCQIFSSQFLRLFFFFSFKKKSQNRHLEHITAAESQNQLHAEVLRRVLAEHAAELEKYVNQQLSFDQEKESLQSHFDQEKEKLHQAHKLVITDLEVRKFDMETTFWKHLSSYLTTRTKCLHTPYFSLYPDTYSHTPDIHTFVPSYPCRYSCVMRKYAIQPPLRR